MGVLQTSSRYHGDVLEKLTLPVPEYSAKTDVLEEKNPQGQDLFIGYRYIDDTPFILMIVKKKNELMKPWFRIRLELIAFLLISVTVILSVILGTAAYMVKNIRIADEKRIITLHNVEYANKMASIGRMAASVAHEINNPLAIINEKAGLIKDLCLLREENAADKKFLGLVDSILGSVKRAGRITKRLLSFSRNLEAGVEPVDLKEVIAEVLGFVSKEAELRTVGISVDVPDGIPRFECDRGKLEQIFLNIINNAFAAVNDGGRLEIKAGQNEKDFVSVSFTDDGCGISSEDISHIYEPFFSRKTGQGGTGLGLSITYALVQEIGGKIGVQSELGKGTSFTVFIPLAAVKEERENTCG
jgi:signal transduction histidine kinase